MEKRQGAEVAQLSGDGSGQAGRWRDRAGSRAPAFPIPRCRPHESIATSTAQSRLAVPPSVAWRPSRVLQSAAKPGPRSATAILSSAHARRTRLGSRSTGPAQGQYPQQDDVREREQEPPDSFAPVE